MQCEARNVGDVSVVSLSGKLVSGVGDVLLRETINQLLADNRLRILVNLSEVTHIDSSGVGELVASRRIAKRFGGVLRLVKPVGTVERVLRLGHILPLFKLHESEEEGITDLQAVDLPKRTLPAPGATPGG